MIHFSRGQTTRMPPAPAPAPARPLQLSLLPDPAAVLGRRLLLRAAHRLALPLRGDNAVRLLSGGDAQLERTRTLIRQARHSLRFEIYLWADDAVGRELAELLAAAAGRGVSVAGIVDAVGSWGSEGLLASLEAVGIAIRRFHPVAPWRPLNIWNRRNHRKLLMADGCEAVIGSANWSLDYTLKANPEAFVDLGLALRGPSLADLVEDFNHVWRRSGGAPLPPLELEELPPLEPDLWLEGATVQVLSSAGRFGHRALRRNLFRLLRGLQTELLVANAYFLPGRALVRRLRRLARRGLSVRLLLPGPSDQAFVQAASRASFEKLLEAGVRIFERRDRMLHAKAALLDGETAIIGSANLDPRSYRHNLELDLLIRHPGIGPELRRFFETQVGMSEEIRPGSWKQRSLRQRWWERFAALFRWWL